MSADYDALLRHAKSYGADCIAETVEQLGLSRREVLLLKLRCSQLAPLKNPKGGRVPESVGKAPTPEERRELVRLLTAEGHTTTEVSAMTGFTAAQVGRALRKDEGEAA
jgi:hypothetical protein